MDTDTDTDSDSDDVPCTTPNTTYTIYVPTFLDDVLLSQMLITDLNAELLKKNWLTPELVREIESCFPTKEEISNTSEGDNIRDLDAFKAEGSLSVSNSWIRFPKCFLMHGLSTRFTSLSGYVVPTPQRLTRNQDSIQTGPNDGRLKPLQRLFINAHFKFGTVS
jgi:hypothetical protein